MRILIGGGSRNGYQTKRIQEEAVKRGHLADIGKTKELVVDFSGDVPKVTVGGVDILSYDVLRLLCSDMNRPLWLVAAELMRSLGKTVVDDRPFTIPTARQSTPGEYVSSLEHTLRIPKSVVTQSFRTACLAAEHFGYPCIVKTTDSRKGRGVALVNNTEEIRTFFDSQVRKDVSFVVRERIPNDGDLRVLVIGGKVLGALHRRPKAGDFRANISQGGSGEAFDLGSRPDIRVMAETAAKMCGLAIAGVDIMIHRETNEAYLLEVNESPQIEGFEKYTGLNAAGAMIEYFESLVRE